MDEERIEEMIEALLEEATANPFKFTKWEVEFLESVESVNEVEYLTVHQVEKLMEIYEEKVG